MQYSVSLTLVACKRESSPLLPFKLLDHVHLRCLFKALLAPLPTPGTPQSESLGSCVTAQLGPPLVPPALLCDALLPRGARSRRQSWTRICRATTTTTTTTLSVKQQTPLFKHCFGATYSRLRLSCMAAPLMARTRLARSCCPCVVHAVVLRCHLAMHSCLLLLS